MTEAVVTEGTEKGELRKVCANPACPVHHAKRQHQRVHADAASRAEQDKRRREEALAQATGEAVPVRLMKCDLLFLAQRLTAMLDERRLAVLIRQHGMGKPKEGEAPANLLAAFLPKAEESTLGRILVESVILLPGHNQTDTAKVLREAAHVYKVDVEPSPRSSGRAKEKAKPAKPARKPAVKTPKKPAT